MTESVGFEPRIVAFLCRWCAGSGADLAGTSRLKYPPNAIPIRVNCSGRVEPSWVVAALKAGADGVFIGGCHPGDCHYVSGNYKARRRVHLLRKVLAELGVEPERVRLEWVSATEATRFARLMAAFVAELRGLGPGPFARQAFDSVLASDGALAGVSALASDGALASDRALATGGAMATDGALATDSALTTGGALATGAAPPARP